MTRSKQILALLISLVTLAVVAPTVSATTTPNPYRFSEPQGIRWNTVEPNPFRYVAPEGRLSPNPYRYSDPHGIRYNGRLAPTGRLAPKTVKVRF